MSTALSGKQEIAQHSVQMDQRRQASITGVSDVCSFHETEIVLKVETGLMFIAGEDLHIGKLLLEEGRLDVEGQIDSLIYEKPKIPMRQFFGRKFRK